jgi:hypothetical protein
MGHHSAREHYTDRTAQQLVNSGLAVPVGPAAASPALAAAAGGFSVRRLLGGPEITAMAVPWPCRVPVSVAADHRHSSLPQVPPPVPPPPSLSL